MILLVTINTIRYRGQGRHYYPSMTFSEIFHHIYHQINVLPACPVNSFSPIPLLSSSFRPSQSLFSLFLLPPNSLAPHHCQNGLPKIPMWPHHLHSTYKLTKHLRGKWIKDIMLCAHKSAGTADPSFIHFFPAMLPHLWSPLICFCART